MFAHRSLGRCLLFYSPNSQVHRTEFFRILRSYPKWGQRELVKAVVKSEAQNVVIELRFDTVRSNNRIPRRIRSRSPAFRVSTEWDAGRCWIAVSRLDCSSRSRTIGGGTGHRSCIAKFDSKRPSGTSGRLRPLFLWGFAVRERSLRRQIEFDLFHLNRRTSTRMLWHWCWVGADTQRTEN